MYSLSQTGRNENEEKLEKSGGKLMGKGKLR